MPAKKIYCYINNILIRLVNNQENAINILKKEKLLWESRF